MTQIGAYKHPDLFIAFNSGIHCFLDSWIPTLVSILNAQVPLCLTSHDEEDHKKQFQVFQNLCQPSPGLMGFEILVDPIENPFFCYRVRLRTVKQLALYNSKLFVVKGVKGICYGISQTGGKIHGIAWK